MKVLDLLLLGCWSPPGSLQRLVTEEAKVLLLFLFLSRWKPFAPIEVTSTVICNLLICWGRQSILKRWGMLRCAEDGKQGWSWKGVLMLQVLSHLPSSVWSMHAGFCRYEEWIGLKPTHMMNRFRFTISGCNLVWWLQREKKKKKIVLKGIGSKSYADCQLSYIFPSQARIHRVWTDDSERLVYHGSAAVAHCLNMLLTNLLQGIMSWLKTPSWLQCGERSSNIRYIKAQVWRPLGFPLGNLSHSVAQRFLKCVIDFVKAIAALFWVLPSRPTSFKQYTALL